MTSCGANAILCGCLFRLAALCHKAEQSGETVPQVGAQSFRLIGRRKWHGSRGLDEAREGDVLSPAAGFRAQCSECSLQVNALVPPTAVCTLLLSPQSAYRLHLRYVHGCYKGAYVNIVYRRAGGCAVVVFLLFAFLELQILSLLSLVMSKI